VARLSFVEAPPPKHEVSPYVSAQTVVQRVTNMFLHFNREV